MPRRGFCRICQYWKDYPYKISERELFEEKCRKGVSLRKLELLLEAYGLKAKKDLINKHIHGCMGLEVKTQRDIEKSIQREGLKRVAGKVKGFFIRPKEDPILPTECPHTNTENFFDLGSERVLTRCRKCGEILSGSFDPHKKKTKKRNDLLILESLRK